VDAVQQAHADPGTAAMITMPVSTTDLAQAAAKRTKDLYKGLDMTPEY
jgi:hypothetical protein